MAATTFLPIFLISRTPQFPYLTCTFLCGRPFPPDREISRSSWSFLWNRTGETGVGC
jgi:hypothetical protein